jgi:glycosyltransferase involved in cell wall biosynthesis
LDAVKRIGLLIEACSKAGASVLTLVGIGELRDDLATQAQRAGVHVVFAGSVPQRALPSLLQQSAVFALTSTVEGHPKALLEAMACAMPCVGVRAPGIEDVIESGATGLLSGADAVSLAAALTHLFDDAAARRKLGAAARAEIVRTLDFATIMANELELVTALLHGSGAAGVSHAIEARA